MQMGTKASGASKVAPSGLQNAEVTLTSRGGARVVTGSLNVEQGGGRRGQSDVTE